MAIIADFHPTTSTWVAARCRARRHQYHYPQRTSPVLRDTWNNVRDALTAVAEEGIGQANKHRRDCRFKVGDHVMIKMFTRTRVPQSHDHHVLSPRRAGPHEIIEAITRVAFRLDVPPNVSTTSKSFNANWLKPYHNAPDDSYPL